MDVDFRNPYNAMDQSALWMIMRRSNIPDVDLSTVRLQDRDEDGVTLTFDTGVAQGSALSLLLFIIFMNTLLRLLTHEGKLLGRAGPAVARREPPGSVGTPPAHRLWPFPEGPHRVRGIAPVGSGGRSEIGNLSAEIAGSPLGLLDALATPGAGLRGQVRI